MQQRVHEKKNSLSSWRHGNLYRSKEVLCTWRGTGKVGDKIQW
jgi:hypothetical protein